MDSNEYYPPSFDHSSIVNNNNNTRFFDVEETTMDNNEYSDDPSSFDHANIVNNNNNTRFFDVGVDVDLEEVADADVDEAPIHDQLPNVEEVKAGLQGGRRQQFSPRNRRLFVLGGILFVCLLSLGGFILATKPRRYRNAIVSVTKTIPLSRYEGFNDPDSPQSQALQWMVYNDPRQLKLPTHRNDPFVQRYIAAVLIFAVAPLAQTRIDFNLLSTNHECKWNSNWKRVDDRHPDIINADTKDVELGFICGNQHNDDEGHQRPGPDRRKLDENIKNIVNNQNSNNGFTHLSDEIRNGGNGEKADEDYIHSIINNENSNTGFTHLSDEIGNDGSGEKADEDYIHSIINNQNSNSDFYSNKNGSDDVNNSITAIILPKAGLVGELPPEVEALKYLKKIDLDGNNIQGKIPAMPYLTHLSVAFNELTGSLPGHFSEMTRLQFLSLNENSYQGQLPKKIGALTDLKVLALNGNELTGGIAEVNSLSLLEELNLSHNAFDDRLTNNSFEQLSNLKVMDLKSNRISGPLPDSLWTLTNLEVIDFHGNALDGHINDVIVPGHSLKYLDVSSNILGGGLPHSMSNLRDLTHVDVSYNRFSSKLSNCLANITKMKTLLLTEDDEFGPQPLPGWLRKMTDLEQLSFRLTSRTGTIPPWFGELTKLQILDLDWNHLSGTVPSQLSQLNNLKYLMLNRNKMVGEIPYQVSSLPKLKMLMVDNNSFTGDLKLQLDNGKCPDPIARVIADCGNPGFKCQCCTECCYGDQKHRCNMIDHLIDIEDEYRNKYARSGYAFDDTFTYRYVHLT